MIPVFKDVRERYTTKSCCPVSYLSVVSKVFKKQIVNRLVGHIEKYDFFLISNMVLGLVDTLRIF